MPRCPWAVPASGNRAVTRKPRPGSGAARTSPPYIAARSRIPMMPLPATESPLPPLPAVEPLPSSVTSRVSVSSW